MAKLCPRGKAAAKRKFKVYPSAYANMYASAVCSGKVTPGGKKNRKKAMGGGMMDKRIGLKFGAGPKPLETEMDKKKADQTKNVKRLMTQSDAYDPEKRFIKGTRTRGDGGSTNFIRVTTDQTNLKEAVKKAKEDNPGFRVSILKPEDMRLPRSKRSKGGRAMYKSGMRVCKLAMKGKGRAYGKNS